MKALTIGLAILVVALALAPAAQAESAAARYSGTITAIDPSHDTITVQSVGPTAPGTSPKFEKRTIHLTGSTKVQMAERAAQGGHMGFPNAWTDRPYASSQLATGDFVTVETDKGARGLTASAVEVVKTEGGAAASTESQPAASPGTRPAPPSR